MIDTIELFSQGETLFAHWHDDDGSHIDLILPSEPVDDEPSYASILLCGED